MGSECGNNQALTWDTDTDDERAYFKIYASALPSAR